MLAFNFVIEISAAIFVSVWYTISHNLVDVDVNDAQCCLVDQKYKKSKKTQNFKKKVAVNAHICQKWPFSKKYWIQKIKTKYKIVCFESKLLYKYSTLN